MNRIVRSGLTPDFARMRAASMTAATPVALSTAPVPRGVESMCAPTMTYWSGHREPGISATTFVIGLPSWNVDSSMVRGDEPLVSPACAGTTSVPEMSASVDPQSSR